MKDRKAVVFVIGLCLVLAALAGVALIIVQTPSGDQVDSEPTPEAHPRAQVDPASPPKSTYFPSHDTTRLDVTVLPVSAKPTAQRRKAYTLRMLILADGKDLPPRDEASCLVSVQVIHFSDQSIYTHSSQAPKLALVAYDGESSLDDDRVRQVELFSTEVDNSQTDDGMMVDSLYYGEIEVDGGRGSLAWLLEKEHLQFYIGSERVALSDEETASFDAFVRRFP